MEEVSWRFHAPTRLVFGEGASRAAGLLGGEGPGAETRTGTEVSG
jgi:hypothetical protein